MRNNSEQVRAIQEELDDLEVHEETNVTSASSCDLTANSFDSCALPECFVQRCFLEVS